MRPAFGASRRSYRRWLLGTLLGCALSVPLTGCGPGAVSGCSVRQNARHRLVASLTLTNRTSQPIVREAVLVTTQLPGSRGANRLFTFAARIAPGQARVVDGYVADSASYDFKDSAASLAGCEVETLTYADGTSWEMPSPL